MASGDVKPKTLGGPTLLGTTETVVVPADDVTFKIKTIKQIIICNTDGVDRTVKIGVNGIAAANCVIFQMPIAGYDTVVFDTGMTLEPYLVMGTTYGFLSGSCDTASKVTVTAVGWETEP